VCREWQRAQQRQRLSARGFQPDTRPPAEQEVDTDCVHALREAITQLPRRERLALHAYYLMELDAEQARSALELSRSGLYRVLSRARRRLRRVLSKQEVHP
jgi:RNA polymerase sigma factor (sigma-70 family)